MKTTKLAPVLFALLLGSILPSIGQTAADKKKQEEDAKKKKEQYVIVIDSSRYSEKELQKAMEESFAAEEKALKAKMKEGYFDTSEYLRRAEELQNSKRKLNDMRSAGQDWNAFTMYGNPSMNWQGGAHDAINIYNSNGNRENSSLSISKSLEDVTFSTDFFYDVKSGSSKISFFVNGTLKGGELKITLKKPDKSTFQEITISPLADINWNQQFSWDEDESDGYLGKWIISISATKANGNYRVQVNSR